MIFYGKQTIETDDIEAVERVITSAYITTGPKVKIFEEDFARKVGSKYAVAVSSGTAALHIACLAAKLTKGDELITSPMTFAASANCALYCNAFPVFVDIKEENGLIDEDLIVEKITNKTKIIIPVHYSGLPCEMKKIKEIADKNNIIIIEDAAHALGTKYQNTNIGDCTYSDMAVFSFHPVKSITTGEGGMITTNSEELYKRLKKFRNHGAINDQTLFERKTEGAWFYEMTELGFNYRLTDFQGALGINQLKKLDRFIDQRRKIALKYNKEFEDNGNIEIIEETMGNRSSCHLYIIRVKNKEIRLDLYNYFHKNGIKVQIHYIPVYWHPYYRKKLDYKDGICPKAELFYDRIISIPIYPMLKQNEQEFVIEKIHSFFKEKKN